MSDDFISATKRLLRERPVDSHHLEYSDHHRRLVIRYAGKARALIFPTSTGDAFRGARNFRSDLRRALNALGVPKPVRAPSPHRARARCAAPRPIAPPAEKAAPRADWKDGLRDISRALFGGEIGTET